MYLPITPESPKKDFLPPIGVREGNYVNYKYDLIAVHVRYNRKAMDTFMKPHTHYITIIRDPGTQFESAFTHFQLDDAFTPAEKQQYKFKGMPSKIEHFLSNPTYYRNRLSQLQWEGKKGLRWYYSKNNQMFDLGLGHKFHDNVTKVNEYIEQLDKEMSLVLITEYFDESMVLLKHTLCWSMEDIIYIAKNVRPKRANFSESLRQKMRNWNSVDTKLYNHFNQTLWRKIKEIGPAFDVELATYKRLLSEAFDKCAGVQRVSSQGRYFHWVEYGIKKDAGRLCKLLVEPKRALFFSVWNKQKPKKVKKAKSTPARRPQVPPRRIQPPRRPKPPQRVPQRAPQRAQMKTGRQPQRTTSKNSPTKTNKVLINVAEAQSKATKNLAIDNSDKVMHMNTGARVAGVGPIKSQNQGYLATQNDDRTSSVQEVEAGDIPMFANAGPKTPTQVKASRSSS